MQRGTIWALLGVLLAAAAAFGAEAPAAEAPAAKKPAAETPAEKPEKDDEEKFKDSLIPGYDDSFLVKGDWAGGQKYYREELLKVLAAEKPDLVDGQRLLYADDVCRLFPSIEKAVPSPDANAFGKWLLEYPNFVRLLAAAVRPEDDWVGVFRVLYVLKTKAPLPKPAFENLMVAFAIVYDREVTEADLTGDGGKVVKLFRYYVKNTSKFRDNPRDMPYFMLKYVVDNDVSSAERTWVLDHYGAGTNVATLYMSVPYDHEFKNDGESKNRRDLAKKGYTLRHIKKYGGLCQDQAHFAIRVCKSLAIPAAAFSGRHAKTGDAHLWASAARKTGDGWVWQDAGRMGGRMMFQKGTTTDPQTGKALSDLDCWLETQLSRVSATRRLRSRFCLLGALLMDEKENRKRAAGLLRLATLQNPYSAEAWSTVAIFCSERKLNADAVWSFYEGMVKRFQDYPQFTKRLLDELRQLIPEENAKKHVKLYDMTWEVYQRRYPTIAARVLVEKAEYLRAQDQTKAAVEVYVDAIMRYRQNGPVVEMLLEHAEEPYREKNYVKGFIALMEKVMSKYNKQRHTAMRGIAYQGTTYYKLVSKLRDLYREVGDKRKARQYELKLKQLKGPIKRPRMRQ